HGDFQSPALPTELSRHNERDCLENVRRLGKSFFMEPLVFSCARPFSSFFLILSAPAAGGHGPFCRITGCSAAPKERAARPWRRAARYSGVGAGAAMPRGYLR